MTCSARSPGRRSALQAPRKRNPQPPAPLRSPPSLRLLDSVSFGRNQKLDLERQSKGWRRAKGGRGSGGFSFGAPGARSSAPERMEEQAVAQGGGCQREDPRAGGNRGASHP